MDKANKGINQVKTKQDSEKPPDTPKPRKLVQLPTLR